MAQRLSPETYPLFAMPAFLRSDNPRAWTSAEAQQHLKWFSAMAPARAEHLMRVGSVSTTSAPVQALQRLGLLAAGVFTSPGFIRMEDGEPILTDSGIALAADLGLVVASYLMRDLPSLHWELENRKRSADFNRPVLAGFMDEIPVDPVTASIALTYRLLDGVGGSGQWRELYEEGLERAQLPPTKRTPKPRHRR